MIELTVKTLDSQNHAFTVEDDITVAQFKVKIAEAINIPADTQRIIYCGRVLQDDSKLSDYDVNGKVVHLVQRAPPSLQNQSSPRAPSPQPQRRGFRGFEHGNRMYLGSVAFPSNLMESQGIVPPPPTHSLAASRLNVARRMLTRAEAVIQSLEDPQGHNPEQSPVFEEQQEEVTPLFEARVIVPDTNEPIDENLAFSALENSLRNIGAVPVNSAGNPAVEEPENITESENANAETTVPEEPVNVEANAQNANTPAENTSNARTRGTRSNARNATENISRTTEMADLLAQLGRLQTRFAPFLERYQNFMREDPVVADEDLRQTQRMINGVSEVLHFLGHAYHSLSDIILKVRNSTPRALLCRPILIQHSAVVQAGFPAQLEAQINIEPITVSTASNGQTATTNTNPPRTSAGTNSTPSNPTTTQQITVNADMLRSVLQLPFMPGVRARAIPSIRVVPRNARSVNNNNVNPPPAETQAQNQAPVGESRAATGENERTGGAAERTDSGDNAGANVREGENRRNGNGTQNREAGTGAPGTDAGGAGSPPHFQYSMQVTPDWIIDSYETAIVGSNEIADVLRDFYQPPPPESLESLVQMASRAINIAFQSQNSDEQAPNGAEPSAPPADSAAPASEAANPTSVAGATAANEDHAPAQDSQARSGTQTTPTTTSTNARSTSRPHVHLAQHAMHTTGFDPFLPCNSHHVSSRRRAHLHNAASNNQQTSAPSQNNNSAQNRAQQRPTPAANQQSTAGGAGNVYNAMHDMLNYYIQMHSGAEGQNAPGGGAGVGQARGAAAGGAATVGAQPVGTTATATFSIPVFPGFLPHLQNMNLSDGARQGPTIAQLLPPDESYEEGQSIFTDLVMFLSRNLTISDVISLNEGRLEPLVRIRTELRTFIMRRVLDGSTNALAVDRGVNRLITEMQSFLDNLGLLSVRDDIDIVRSTQMLFRARLPNIINLAVSRSPNALRMLVDQCHITARQLCALTVRASASGPPGVEDIFNRIVSRYMVGVPRDIQQWTLLMSRAQFQNFMRNLSVPESILQPYIVRRAEAVLPSVMDTIQSEGAEKTEDEPMELDVVSAAGGSSEIAANAINLSSDDSEPLPAVVIGSEVWHSQVPEDWVPIITRDAQKQRRQNPQPAFSDAYLSGMPSKRRKIVTSSKPQGSLPQVITESVRRAVTATGLSSVAPLETVAQAAGADLNVQSAYRDLLRSNVQNTIQDNEDFTPDRFPNASNYFGKQ